MSLFNTEHSTEARDIGMELAATKRAALLNEAREAARLIALAHKRRECTADDVGQWFESLPTPVDIAKELGPSMGSLFKGREWEFTGKRVRSSRVSNHARELKVWRLV